MNSDLIGSLGKVEYSSALLECFTYDYFFFQLEQIFDNYKIGKWGDTSTEGKKLNDNAIMDGGRIIAIYEIDDFDFQYIYIDTLVDRSSTIVCPLEVILDKLNDDLLKDVKSYDVQSELDILLTRLPYGFGLKNEEE